jgi:hypothetical protein
MKISIAENTYWAVFHAMDIFSSGFIAKIPYLDKIAKIKKNYPWGHFREIFGFWDISKILYFFIFCKLKKIMFEKKSEKKTISCVNYGYVFFTSKFSCFFLLFGFALRF